MSSFLLTPDEVAELTGAARSSGQLEWLQAHGLHATRGRDGKVKVLRAAVEAKFMPGATRNRTKTEPNLAALKKAS